MTTSRWRLAALTLMLLVTLGGCSGGKPSTDIPDDDPEMVDAIARARETLPEFWSVFEKQDLNEARHFSLKVRMSDKNGSENLWLANLDRHDGQATGVVDSHPNIVSKVKRGDRIEVPEADIIDWFYMRDGKIYGNHTLRVLFRNMPASEVEFYKKKLAEP